jgi:hypothetical protein
MCACAAFPLLFANSSRCERSGDIVPIIVTLSRFLHDKDRMSSAHRQFYKALCSMIENRMLRSCTHHSAFSKRFCMNARMHVVVAIALCRASFYKCKRSGNTPHIIVISSHCFQNKVWKRVLRYCTQVLLGRGREGVLLSPRAIVVRLRRAAPARAQPLSLWLTPLDFFFCARRPVPGVTAAPKTLIP